MLQWAVFKTRRPKHTRVKFNQVQIRIGFRYAVCYYLLSVDMERLLERGRAVSFLSLVIGGSEEEEHGEKMEAVELSLEAAEESKAVSRKISIFTLVTINLNA